MSETCRHVELTESGRSEYDINGVKHHKVFYKCANRFCERYGKTVKCVPIGEAPKQMYHYPMPPVSIPHGKP